MHYLEGNVFYSYLFLLLGVHAVTDYAWQPEWMAKYKHPNSHPPKGLGPWWWSLTAHGLINGVGVAWVTHWWLLGVMETIVHAATDYAKCSKVLTPQQDQAIHLASKVLWAWLAV